MHISKHYLTPLFAPRSIAVFGASNTEDSVGYVVFKNLLDNHFQGELHAINPKYDTVQEHPCYKTVWDVGKPIDLAVIATPARTVHQLIEMCGQYGVKTAVILSAGFSEIGHQGARLESKIVDTAKRFGMRFLGPNSLGLIRPSAHLNATFLKGIAHPGHLALVSQSGSLCAAVLDWAERNDVGFSAIISTGTSANLDFGEVLDFLVSDPQTHGILLYIEGIHHARSFISGLRAAARIKPVIVLKSGHHEHIAPVIKSHSGAMMGRDDAFDAALQRAGVVRVNTFGQLFAAARTLASRYKAEGNRLAVITNGGGPGVMAIDLAVDLNIPIAKLTPETIKALDKELPPLWSHANPVDIGSDATETRYEQAVSICLKDPNIDALLVILTPQAMTHPLAVATKLIEIAEQSSKPILACWMGGTQVNESRRLFIHARIPEFHTPEAAIEAFSYLSAYHQNQQLLMQTPGSLGHNLEPPDVEGARIIIESVLGKRRKSLTEMESKALLGAFNIPVINTAIAHSPNEALVLAETLRFPVAMKINSPDIPHKSDVGGVRLNINSAPQIREAYKQIMQQVKEKRPDAQVDGITVERMSNKRNGRELMVGLVRDPVFGPVITFGIGGTMVEVIADKAVSLPPLNHYLASSLIDKTRAARLLEQFRQMPPANREALVDVLLRVSEMACELPWIQTMDINPLIIDENGAVAVDAHIVVDYYSHYSDPYSHMAIYPYPTHLVNQWQLPDGTDIIIRPIRPEDAEIEQEFVRDLSDESKYFRFMQTLHELTPIMLVRFTQIDYDREMALIAVTHYENEQGETTEVEIGVARYAINPDGESCEFALVISDKWQHRGIANKLMMTLMDTARSRGLKMIQGEVLSNNHNMLKLMSKLGFSGILDEEDRNITLVNRNL